MLNDLETLAHKNLERLQTKAFTLQNGNSGNLNVISEVLSELTMTVCSWIKQPHVTVQTCEKVHKERTEEFAKMLTEVHDAALTPKTKAEKVRAWLFQMPLPVAIFLGGPLTALVWTHADEFAPVVKGIVKWWTE